MSIHLIIITAYAISCLLALIYLVWDTTSRRALVLDEVAIHLFVAAVWPGMLLIMGIAYLDLRAPRMADVVVIPARQKKEADNEHR